jgi:hypothetical protein
LGGGVEEGCWKEGGGGGGARLGAGASLESLFLECRTPRALVVGRRRASGPNFQPLYAHRANHPASQTSNRQPPAPQGIWRAKGSAPEPGSGSGDEEGGDGAEGEGGKKGAGARGAGKGGGDADDEDDDEEGEGVGVDKKRLRMYERSKLRCGRLRAAHQLDLCSLALGLYILYITTHIRIISTTIDAYTHR